jgi:hypothetical protein
MRTVYRLGLPGAAAVVLVAAACAATSPGRTPDSFTAELPADTDAAAVLRCVDRALTVRGYQTQTTGTYAVSGRRNTGERISTAYGEGDVSSGISASTRRTATGLSLAVTAGSVVFPESGRGAENSNIVRIRATAATLTDAQAVFTACA